MEDIEKHKQRFLTSDEFEKILCGEFINDKNYSDFYSDDEHVVYDSVIFENCIITEYSRIENKAFDRFIYLGDGVVFEDSVSFLNCDFTSFQISQTIFQKELEFEEVYFQKLEILGGTFNSGLSIENCTLSSRGRLLISGGLFEGRVIICGNYDGQVKISGGYFKSNFEIGQAPRQSKRSNFDDFEITGGVFEKHILISNSNFKNDFALVSSEIKMHFLQFRNSHFEEKCTFGRAEIEILCIFSGSLKKGIITYFAKIKEFYITGGEFSEIHLKEGELKKITINHRDDVDNTRKLSSDKLSIQEIKIQQSSPLIANFNKKSEETNLKKVLFLGTLHKDSIIQINNFKLQVISFEYFINLGYICFNNIDFESEDTNVSPFKLSIINSDLGKTQFIDCQLSYFKNEILEYANSKMLDVFISGTDLPQNIVFPNTKLNHNNSWHKKDIRTDEQKELVFNQLKKVYENRGDIVNALEYHSKALNARRKILSEELFIFPFDKKGKINCFKNALWSIFLLVVVLIKNWQKPHRKKFSEWLNLSISQLSNNHGSSWQRSLFLTIILWALSYWFYCNLAGFQIGNFCNQHDKDLFYKLASYAGDFLNPIQKEDVFRKFYDKDSLIDFPKARIFSFFSRILLAYFVYQTIQAFRKYGKK